MSDAASPAVETERSVQRCPFDIRIRAFDPDDAHFVISSWLRSYRDYKPQARDEKYYYRQQQLITTLSTRCPMAVACDAKLPGFILGWACAEPYQKGQPFIAHYAFTKLTYRNNQIAQRCFKALGWAPGMDVLVTHWTSACKKNREKYNLESDEGLLNIGGPLHNKYAQAADRIKYAQES